MQSKAAPHAMEEVSPATTLQFLESKFPAALHVTQ